MIIQSISPKKQLLIDAINNSELKPGDEVTVRYNALSYYFFDDKRDDQRISCQIITISDDGILVKRLDSSRLDKPVLIQKSDITARNTRLAGDNPFAENRGEVRTVNWDLESILFNCDILGNKREMSAVANDYTINGILCAEISWNPFVYDKSGNKQYYQRPFVWTINDKQLLIESIYRGIDCGRILLRKRSWDELTKMSEMGETELSFRDIVDGKQRLNAVKEFILDEFPDANGSYYSDLSAYAQHRFVDQQLFGYSEMGENSKDADVIFQFLKLNFTGVPQSAEHIQFVKSLYDKM